jgi:hypothetical protein
MRYLGVDEAVAAEERSEAIGRRRREAVKDS